METVWIKNTQPKLQGWIWTAVQGLMLLKTGLLKDGFWVNGHDQTVQLELVTSAVTTQQNNRQTEGSLLTWLCLLHSKCYMGEIVQYTYAEIDNLHLMFGQPYGSERDTCCMYQSHFSHRHIPDWDNFSAIERRFSESGTFNVQPHDHDWPRRMLTSQQEGKILDLILQIQWLTQME